MKKFSPAFMAALMSVSIITHACADTATLTPEQIERMYIAEMKLPGKSLRCFQSGIEIIHEPGLQNVKETENHISALRVDGNAASNTILHQWFCSIIS